MFKKNSIENFLGKEKKQVPLLPLRDIVVFPNMITPLFVGRKSSIKAIERAINVNNSKIFPLWNGDLLVGSMRGKTLYRVRPANRSILYAEPIDVGTRIRDLTMDDEGRIILWTDRSEIVVLEAKTADSDSSKFSAFCSGCHDIDDGSSHGIGPDLFNIVGATAGSQEEFDYSPALAGADIRWSEDNLDAYLTNPQALIAGTTMSFAGIADPETRANIIRYLKQNR